MQKYDHRFDFIVVTLSLAALGPLNMPVVVIRSMRAFRIARIFRRIGVIRARTGYATPGHTCAHSCAYGCTHTHKHYTRTRVVAACGKRGMLGPR